MSDRSNTSVPTIHVRRTVATAITVTCDVKLVLHRGHKLRFYQGKELTGEYWDRLGDAAKLIVTACMMSQVRLVTVTADGAEVHMNASADYQATVEDIRARLWDVREETGHQAVEVQMRTDLFALLQSLALPVEWYVLPEVTDHPIAPWPTVIDYRGGAPLTIWQATRFAHMAIQGLPVPDADRDIYLAWVARLADGIQEELGRAVQDEE